MRRNNHDKNRPNLSECPECGSKNIMGYAQVITHAYINLTDMSIDEIDSNSDVELYDINPRYWDYQCRDCENEWDDYGQGKVKENII